MCTVGWASRGRLGSPLGLVCWQCGKGPPAPAGGEGAGEGRVQPGPGRALERRQSADTLQPGRWVPWQGGGRPLGPDSHLPRAWESRPWAPLSFLAPVLQPLLKSPAPPLLHVAALGQKQGILGAQPQLIFQPHRIPPLFPQKRESRRSGGGGLVGSELCSLPRCAPGKGRGSWAGSGRF